MCSLVKAKKGPFLELIWNLLTQTTWAKNGILQKKKLGLFKVAVPSMCVALLPLCDLGLRHTNIPPRLCCGTLPQNLR